MHNSHISTNPNMQETTSYPDSVTFDTLSGNEEALLHGSRAHTAIEADILNRRL